MSSACSSSTCIAFCDEIKRIINLLTSELLLLTCSHKILIFHNFEQLQQTYNTLLCFLQSSNIVTPYCNQQPPSSEAEEKLDTKSSVSHDHHGHHADVAYTVQKNGPYMKS